MKKNKISKNWVNKKNKDFFFKQSKIQGFRSRSAYKLIEINKKFKFLRKKLFLLDLGSSPGGWSQVAAREIIKGKILAVDIKSMQKINKIDFIQGDFCTAEICKKIKIYFNKKIDVILSDMAANTTGIKELDSYRTGNLCLEAMGFAKNFLNKDGVFISKIFMGSIHQEIHEKARMIFKKIVIYKPLSSKKESKEIYIFCKGILNI